MQHLKLPQLREYAERLELDMNRYAAEMDGAFQCSASAEHLESGKASSVRATPACFVNGTNIDVSFGIQRLHDAVQTAPAAST